MKKRVWQLAAVITLILWLGMGSGCSTIHGVAQDTGALCQYVQDHTKTQQENKQDWQQHKKECGTQIEE